MPRPAGRRAASKSASSALGVKVYLQLLRYAGYPSNLSLIVSDEGFGRNDYIETSRRLVVVTAPGPGSGKMATCLSQLYHEHKRGMKAGYAKFETFPIWNLPLKHPVNLAYEAATADLDDVNMIDPFHLEAYGETTVNYNRDVEIFPVLNAMFEQIYGESPYKIPDRHGRQHGGLLHYRRRGRAARPPSRRSSAATTRASATMRQGLLRAERGVYKLELLHEPGGRHQPTDRAGRRPPPWRARRRPAPRPLAMRTARRHASSPARPRPCSAPPRRCLLNALKAPRRHSPRTCTLISPNIIEPIQHLKVEHLGNHNPRLHTDEVLIALSICAVTDPNAEAGHGPARHTSRGCEVHATVILSQRGRERVPATSA